MYKATRDQDFQNIHNPFCQLYQNLPLYHTDSFNASRQHHLVKHGSSRLLNRAILYFFEFSLDTNDCSMYDYVIERTSVRLEGL